MEREVLCGVGTKSKEAKDGALGSTDMSEVGRAGRGRQGLAAGRCLL